MDVKFGQSSLKVVSKEEQLKKIVNGEYQYKIAVYGRSGTGKSRLAATFPCKKLGVLDLDLGGLVYYNTELKDKELIVIEIKPDSDQKDIKAYQTAMDGLNYLVKEGCDCIVVDSVTMLYKAILNWIQGFQGRFGTAPTQPEYGQAKVKMETVINALFGTGKSVVAIFHEEFEKDELTGRVWCNPLIVGKLAKEIPMYFDEVYHMEPVQKGSDIEYRMMIRSSSTYTCKSRLESVLGIKVDTYQPPNLKKYIDTVREAVSNRLSKPDQQ